ncbi:MAG: GGDEF domain-containing protein [Oscillospiraceae bacterium]|nr:GGDEF domain-containing protein [Oscillospiraceae bacterium]
MKQIRVDEQAVSFVRKHMRLIESFNKRRVLLIGFAACLVAHILYLVLFFVYGIRELALFNVFSVSFYILMVAFSASGSDGNGLVYLALMEIIIHAVVCTVYVGWGPDFGMFLLMILPITFFLPNKKIYIPYLFSFFSVTCYVVLRVLITDQTEVKYEVDRNEWGMVLYLFNAVIGTGVVLYSSTLYMFYREYLEYKLRTQNDALRTIAAIDPLTKLSNRRAMGESLKAVQLHSAQVHQHYAVVIGDIDDFKHVNDTYGHDIGDEVLVFVAGLFARYVPDSGYAARWGGEEFLFVLPDAAVSDGVSCTDEIHRELHAHVFTTEKGSFHVTMTFGVSEGGEGDNIEHIITAADQLLYKGKNSGKDHTEFAI